MKIKSGPESGPAARFYRHQANFYIIITYLNVIFGAYVGIHTNCFAAVLVFLFPPKGHRCYEDIYFMYAMSAELFMES